MDNSNNWKQPKIEDLKIIKTGDMPGDKIDINESHVAKAGIIFPRLLELLNPILDNNEKAVISVHGGSGVGKSETGSLIGHYLNEMGIGAYIISGDNYPHRIPSVNDAERLRIFRENGIKGLVASGEYKSERNDLVLRFQVDDIDSDKSLVIEYPWFDNYLTAGRTGLQNYLGTKNETDFDEISTILNKFKQGDERILLKRMGRTESELWYDSVDFSDIQVVIIEWTHGNNPNLHGVDIPILLNSTPEETLAHRKSRNRDGGTDAPFTMMVLEIEQEKLFNQSPNAKIILTKDGELITHEGYMKLMKDQF